MKNAIAILALVVAWSTAFSQDVVKLKAKDLEAGQIVIADTMRNGVIRFVTRQLSAALDEAGAGGFNTGNVLYVSTTGDNATAVKGNPGKAYRDPWAAKDAAVAGDVVYIYPGTYTIGKNGAYDKSVSNYTDKVDGSIVKDSIVMYMEAGATIESFADTSDYYPLIYDNSGARFSVLGNGKFVTHAHNVAFSYINAANSNITINIDELQSNMDNTGWGRTLVSVNCNYFSFKCNYLLNRHTMLIVSGRFEAKTGTNRAFFNYEIGHLEDRDSENTMMFARNYSTSNTVSIVRVGKWIDNGFTFYNVFHPIGENINIDFYCNDAFIRDTLVGGSDNMFGVYRSLGPTVKNNNIKIHFGQLDFMSVDPTGIVFQNYPSSQADTSIFGGNICEISGNYLIRGDGEFFRNESSSTGVTSPFFFNANVLITSTDSSDAIFKIDAKCLHPLVITGGHYARSTDGPLIAFTTSNTENNVQVVGGRFFKRPGTYNVFEATAPQVIRVNGAGVFVDDNTVDANITLTPLNTIE